MRARYRIRDNKTCQVKRCKFKHDRSLQIKVYYIIKAGKKNTSISHQATKMTASQAGEYTKHKQQIMIPLAKHLSIKQVSNAGKYV